MDCLAVVPIFVNVSAAVLPVVIAAVTSVLALVLQPRSLWALVCRRPLMVALCSGALIIGMWIVIEWTRAPRASRAEGPPQASMDIHYDWAQVARDLIAQQQARQMAPVSVSAAKSPVYRAVSSVLSRNSSRCFYAGGPVPLQLTPLWSYTPEETLFLGQPRVVGNQVYVAGSQSDLGGYTGLLACLDAESGKALWQITEMQGEFLLPFFSSPAVTEDGQYLVIGQGLHSDRDCSLLCYYAKTGQLHWRVQTPLHIESSPAIFGDSVVVGAGAIEGTNGRALGDPGFCLAVRISDGKEMWRYPVNDPESSPAVDEQGRVYIGSGCNGNAVVALRSDSPENLQAQGLDRLIWRRPVTQAITGPITLAGQIVIAGGGNSNLVHSHRDAQGLVVALDRETGAILWQTSFEDAVLGGIAYYDTTLICPVRTGEVVALALEDGHERWRTRINGETPVLAGCAFTGTHVYAASSDGVLAVLDAQDGKLLEKVYLNDQARPGSGLSLSAPQINAGRVLVGSETGGLRCLVGASGEGRP
jgi:outer membrane protein assembly factor BamB